MAEDYDKIHRQTIARINSLRGLFAIMIVIGHCSMHFEKELLPLMLIHKFNMVSVCFFFMASGISLSYNLEHKKDYLKGFVRKKILLLMFFSIMAQIVGEILNAIVLDEPITFGLGLITGWNWYIYEMAVLYLIFYIVNSTVKKSYIREILFWALSFGICLTTLYFYKNGSWAGWIVSYYFSTLSFPLGITLYLHFENLSKTLCSKPFLKSFILFSIAAGACISLAMPKDTILAGIFLRNIIGCCIMLILFIILNYVDVTNIPVISRLVSFLTTISTEIYLYQFCMLSLWASVYNRLGMSIDLLYVCAVVVCTVLIGYIMHFVDAAIARVVK